MLSKIKGEVELLERHLLVMVVVVLGCPFVSFKLAAWPC